jgi:MFS family permease
MAIAAFVASRYLDRTGAVRTVVLTGLALLTCGYVALVATPWAPVAALFVGMSLIGAGTATVIPNLILMVHNAVPQRLTSSSGGMVIFGNTLGGAAGIAVSSVFVTELARDLGGGPPASAVPALYGGYAVVALAALVLVLRIRIAPLRDTIELLDPLPG